MLYLKEGTLAVKFKYFSLCGKVVWVWTGTVLRVASCGHITISDMHVFCGWNSAKTASGGGNTKRFHFVSLTSSNLSFAFFLTLPPSCFSFSFPLPTPPSSLYLMLMGTMSHIQVSISSSQLLPVIFLSVQIHEAQQGHRKTKQIVGKRFHNTSGMITHLWFWEALSRQTSLGV